MSFFDTLWEMLVILFAMAAGYLASRLEYLNGETNQRLAKVIMNITMPALIVSAVITGDSLPGPAEILSVLKAAFFFYALQFAVALVVPRFLGGTVKQKGVWRFALVFTNMAFIGYPVVTALFGPEALFYAVILNVPFNILSYTLGPLMLVGAKQFRWRQMLTPCTVAAAEQRSVPMSYHYLLDLALILLSTKFLGIITGKFQMPRVVGSLLAGLPMGQVFRSPRLWCLSVLRLLVLPGALFVVLRAVGTEPVLTGIAVTEMAMPVAINGSMLSMEHGGDTECMAQATLLTTAASIITIPLITAALL